ncbi:hypothetical protein [Alcaligenes faecalis]|uniref:hypothetical protein n=1 Tax=Alcaligenes faecalis TaxID=511 RepID=UPI00208F10DB|nr:hypothetical protein [Alcaligenes faecalis]USP46946.1 hypothetical protein J5J84_13000 [Alcaligenes faecalis]
MSKSLGLLELKKYKKPSLGMAFLLLAILGVQVSLFGLLLLGWFETVASRVVGMCLSSLLRFVCVRIC